MTESDYWSKVEYLQDKDPLNPLLAKLRSGYNLLHAMYVINEIKAIPVKVKPAPVERKVAQNAATTMEIELRHLRASRDELSNAFHSCVTDGERARISDAITERTDRIKEIISRLDVYQENKEVAELPKNDKYPVPDNDLDMYKLNHNLRTYITRCSKNLDELHQRMAVAKPVDAARLKTKIEDQETRLRELKIHKQYVQQSINIRKNI